MDKVCRYKFRVVEDVDLVEINNLRRNVNEAVKHPEPVLSLVAPWDQKWDKLAWANVLYDEEDQLFKMWYSVVRRKGDDFDGSWKTAYAISRDGVHWDKPILGMVEDNGSKKNNYILPEMGVFAPSIVIDPSDIPARRYKMLAVVEGVYGSDRGTAWAKFHCPVSLAYSADGIVWDRPPHVNPVIRGVADGGTCLFYDPDRRKYVLLTRRVPNLPRDVSQYESYDLVNWEDRGRILVPGDEYDAPDMFNIQYMVVVRDEDLYLGLISTHYSLPHGDVFEHWNAPPADYPNPRLGQIDIQLAYSRDGYTWARPEDRSPVVPNGEPGSLDAGILFPSPNPIVRNGETWIYYRGYTYRHNHWSQQDPHPELDKEDFRDRTSIMLARMPEDHWVSLDAVSGEGCFVCKPWGPPHEVFVNADAEGGSIAVELVTPYGETMPGYSRQECIAVTGNGKDQEIKWQNGRHPFDFAEEYRGGVLAKFYLKNAKLYSYTFTLPDADGQLERDRVNNRWLESIKHRSDNWGQSSTEPAIGLRQLGGPGS